VNESVSGANPTQLRRATPQATEQFGNAILESQIGERGSGWLHRASGARMALLLMLEENKTLVIGSTGACAIHREGWRKLYLAMLAWGVLLAIGLVLASLLQAVAATALAVSETALPADHFSVSPATVWVETLYATPESCSVPATDDKACIS
jgi:hypothetical protein